MAWFMKNKTVENESLLVEHQRLKKQLEELKKEKEEAEIRLNLVMKAIKGGF